MDKHTEIIKLTEESLMVLLQGKDLYLRVGIQEEDKRTFIFRGPWDGVFLTHQEISEMQYNSQVGVFNIMERMVKHVQEGSDGEPKSDKP